MVIHAVSKRKPKILFCMLEAPEVTGFLLAKYGDSAYSWLEMGDSMAARYAQK